MQILVMSYLASESFKYGWYALGSFEFGVRVALSSTHTLRGMIKVSVTHVHSLRKTLRNKEFRLSSLMGYSLGIGYQKVNFQCQSIALMSL